MAGKITLKNAIASVGVSLPVYSSVLSMPGDPDVGSLCFNSADGFIYVYSPLNKNDPNVKGWNQVPPITTY